MYERCGQGANASRIVLLLLCLAIWPAATAAQECGDGHAECRRSAGAAHRSCVTSCPRTGGPCRTHCRDELDLTLRGCDDGRDACEECRPQFEACEDRADGAFEDCVTSCPPDDGRCTTTCRNDLDLTSGVCRDDRDDCQECETGCDRAERRCQQRARDGDSRCSLSCVRTLTDDLGACRQQRHPLLTLLCVGRALASLGRCSDGCGDTRVDDFAACVAFDDGCHDICGEYLLPDFGAYGTLTNFSVREEAHLGCGRRYPGGFPDQCASPGAFERDAYQRTSGTEFIDLPWMTTKFLARHADAVAAVTFSAIEAQNLSENFHGARGHIIVRALVDGQELGPGEVRLSRTALASGGAFTFVSGPLAEGIHIAKLQWRVDDDPLSADEVIGLLRSGTLMVRSGAPISPDGEAGAVLAVAAAAPEEPQVELGGMFTGAWVPVTQSDGVTPLIVDFLVPTDAAVAITFSAEVAASHFGALDVRARIAEGSLDAGQVMYAQHLPAPDRGSWPPAVDGFAARSFTFTSTSLKPGWNTVEFDWRYRFRQGVVDGPPDGIQSVAMHRRAVAVAAASRRDPYSRIEIVAPPADEIDAPQDWQPVDGLSHTVEVPENAQVAVTFDGEIVGTNLVQLRLSLDGAVVPDTELDLAQAIDATGALTHTYALKHLAAGDYTIGVEWRAAGNGGEATMATRNLVLAIEELPVPDLGDGPDVAAGAQHATTSERPIEPLDGARPVLIVLVDPQRPQVDEITIDNTPDGTYSVVINGESHDTLAAGDSATDIRDALIDAINAGGQPVSAVAVTSNSPTALAALRIVADELGDNRFTATVVSPDGASLQRCPSGSSCHEAPVPDPDQLHTLAFGEGQSAADFWNVVSGGRLQLVPAGPGVIGPYLPAYTGIEAIEHYWRGAHNCDDQSVDAEYASGHGERFTQGLIAAAESGDFDFAAYDANGDGLLEERELSIVVATPQSTNGGSAYDPNLRPYCDSAQEVQLGDVRMRGILSWYTGNGASLRDVTTLAHELGHFPLGLDDLYTNADHDPIQLSIMSDTSSSRWQHLDGFQKLALGWVAPRIVRVPGSYDIEDVKASGQVFILPRPGSRGREYFLIENRQSTDLGDANYDSVLGDSGLAIYHVVEPTYDGAFACQSDSPGLPDCALMSPSQCLSSFNFSNTSQNYIRRVLRLIRPGVVAQTDGSAALWDLSDGLATDAAPVCPPSNPVAGLVWGDGTPSGYTLGPLPISDEVMTVDIAIAP